MCGGIPRDDIVLVLLLAVYDGTVVWWDPYVVVWLSGGLPYVAV